jgi:hypothetical protein
MLFTDDRTRTRDLFRQAFKKHRANEPLEPLEKQVATLVEEHPEYHSLIVGTDDVLDQDFTSEHGGENPFLHLGLHLALREQVGTDRPRGIRDITRALLLKTGDGHETEHRMLPLLADMLWEAQRQGRAPDEAGYLDRLRRLL